MQVGFINWFDLDWGYVFQYAAHGSVCDTINYEQQTALIRMVVWFNKDSAVHKMYPFKARLTKNTKKDFIAATNMNIYLITLSF